MGPRKIVRASGACSLVCAMAGCVVARAGAPPATTRPAEVRVGIDNFAYTPPVVTVAVGTTVVWVNHDDVPHTVTSEGQGKRVLSSKALDTDDTFSFTFTRAGEYPYFCAVHPHMRARVIVK
jgi:plastocyanin